jgi:hypothetical protein
MFNFFSKNRKLEFDPALGDPLAQTILDETRRGSFNTLFNEIERFRAGRWDERAFYLDLAGHYLGQPQKLNTLPDTPVGNLLRGCAGIHLAWQARGGGTADTVGKDGWQGFAVNLDFAGKSLLRAAAQDQQDPTALALLQTVALFQ